MTCWLVLLGMCLVGIIGAGAWWHIGTAGICAMMAFLRKPKKEKPRQA